MWKYVNFSCIINLNRQEEIRMKIFKSIAMIINIFGYLIIVVGLLQLFNSFLSGVVLIGLGFVMTSGFIKVMDRFKMDFSNKKRVILGVSLICLFSLVTPESPKTIDNDHSNDVSIVDTKKEKQEQKAAEEKKRQQEAEAQAKQEAERLAQEQAKAEAQKAQQEQEAALAQQQREAQAAKEAEAAQQQRQEQAANAARDQTTNQAKSNTAIAQSYIANVNTKKFHLPSCSYLPDQHNQKTFSSRNEAVSAGYAACKKCNP